ncbi:MAG: hypothetical protein NC453_25320 [Muribaculum sp.]|nr:hypothetical protein [Muribaculum sp.]
MCKKLILFTLLTVAAVDASAQICYKDDMLAVGSEFMIDPYDTSVRGNGLYMKNGSRFFKIDLTSTHPAISCTGGRLTFFNHYLAAYDDIYVKRCYVYSDARKKMNVRSLDVSAEMLHGIRPVGYTDSCEFHYAIDADLLAEQFPSMVDSDEDGNKMVNYNALVPVMIGILKDLNTKIDERDAVISELKKKLITIQQMSE